jgi:hypothetical protein
VEGAVLTEGYEALALRRKVLSDPEACKKVFGIELTTQNIIDAIEHLTECAIKCEDDVVELPTSLAAAGVLVLKGLVKRGRGKPYGHRQRRERMQRKLLNRRRVADPMIIWARARMVEIKAAAKATIKAAAAQANRSRIKPDKETDKTKNLATADGAREEAAKEAKQKFESRLSWQEIGRRMERPGKYARG